MAYQQEQINPYTCGDKAQQVEAMFDNIAPTYDTLNHRLSWNIDKGWRRKAIMALASYKPQTILDIATGTGDFAIMSAQMLAPKKLIGADISEGMMDIGRQKVAQLGLDSIIRFEHEDCTALSYADGTFDAVTAAFGIRNFADLDTGLREMCRGTDNTRLVPYEAAVPRLLAYCFARLRTPHIQRYQRLLLSYQDHRSLSARRANGRYPKEGWFF